MEPGALKMTQDVGADVGADVGTRIGPDFLRFFVMLGTFRGPDDLRLDMQIMVFSSLGASRCTRPCGCGKTSKKGHICVHTSVHTSVHTLVFMVDLAG